MKYAFKPGDRPLAGYTIKRAIGRGGFGEVYYAVSDAGKEVALKLLQQDVTVELRGIRQCLNLQHPNLVAIFDVRQDADRDYWIIMEYVGGPTLADEIADHPDGIPLPMVLDWLRPAAEGLQYLHDRGIVHRDVKPANIYRSGQVVKVGDVGLAKFIAPSRRSAHTHSVGTVHYMAPEVARGSYGPEVDVYALATIAYEMLTGRVPFDGETTAEILMRHLTDTPDWTPIPPSARPVLEAALEKDPKRRTASVRAFVKDLEPAASPSVVGAAAVGATGGVGVVNERAAGTPPAATRVPVSPIARAVDGRNRPQAAAAESAEPSMQRPRAGVWDAVESNSAPIAAGQGVGRREPSDAIAERASETVEPAAPENGMRVRLTARRFWGVLAVVAGVWLVLRRSAYMLPLLWMVLSILAVYQLLVFVIGACASWWRSVGGERRHTDGGHRGGGRQPRGAAASEPYAHARFDVRRPVSPEWPRRIPLAKRVVRFAAACPVALVCVAAITAAVNELAYPLGDWPHVAYFGVTACLGAWMLLLLGKLWEGRVHERELRRLSYACVGVAFGFLAWWLAELLLLELRSDFGLFSQVGRHPLVDWHGRPTWMGFVVFFGLLFGLRRWWWHTDELRPKRFRVASVALTSLLAVLLAELFTFPVIWATLWAATVSSAVQVASSWTLVDFETFVREAQRGSRTGSLHAREVRS